ncbi:DUF1566 domain-containing protein, partial [Pseudomonas aeruginosa]
MQAAAQEATILPEIGQAYGGGFVSGFYLQDGKRYVSITAGAEHELVGEWGEYGVKIEGADSLTDSRANTEAMAASGSELAQKVLALEIGGHSDWAIPARDVQELQYRNLKPTTDKNYACGCDGENHSSLPPGDLYSEESPAQTSVEAFKAGGAEAFRPNWYWSSTQRSAN